MDDILVHTGDDLKLHRQKVHHILDKLKEHDLFLKPGKVPVRTKNRRIPRSGAE